MGAISLKEALESRQVLPPQESGERLEKRKSAPRSARPCTCMQASAIHEPIANLQLQAIDPCAFL